jgi:hypothetical protein
MAVPALVVDLPPSLCDIGRNAITASNEVKVLRDVLIREVRALGALYCVGKRRPLSELTAEQQQKVKDAYAETHWASDYCVELQGIYTSKKLAEETCKARGPNYFLTRLPIDSCLTDEVVFGEWEHRFPASEDTDLYENLAAATIAVPVSHLRALRDEIERLQLQVSDLVNRK